VVLRTRGDGVRAAVSVEVSDQDAPGSSCSRHRARAGGGNPIGAAEGDGQVTTCRIDDDRVGDTPLTPILSRREREKTPLTPTLSRREREKSGGGES